VEVRDGYSSLGLGPKETLEIHLVLSYQDHIYTFKDTYPLKRVKKYTFCWNASKTIKLEYNHSKHGFTMHRLLIQVHKIEALVADFWIEYKKKCIVDMVELEVQKEQKQDLYVQLTRWETKRKVDIPEGSHKKQKQDATRSNPLISPLFQLICYFMVCMTGDLDYALKGADRMLALAYDMEFDMPAETQSEEAYAALIACMKLLPSTDPDSIEVLATVAILQLVDISGMNLTTFKQHLYDHLQSTESTNDTLVQDIEQHLNVILNYVYANKVSPLYASQVKTYLSERPFKGTESPWEYTYGFKGVDVNVSTWMRRLDVSSPSTS
jgi:hypothetical protein